MDDFPWLAFLEHPCRGTEARVQCSTKQDVLLFLYMGFQNCPMICLYSLQISGLKVYSRCGPVHLWMFGKMLWFPAARHRLRLHGAVLKTLRDVCCDSAHCCGH